MEAIEQEHCSFIYYNIYELVQKKLNLAYDHVRLGQVLSTNIEVQNMFEAL